MSRREEPVSELRIWRRAQPGGYVGRMKAGVVTNAHAWDAKSVIAYTSAGGFAGEMKTAALLCGKGFPAGTGHYRFYQRSADLCSSYQEFRYYRLPVRNDGEGDGNPG